MKEPGIRINGGNRRDLNKDRVASRMAGLPAHAPTTAQKIARLEENEKRAKAERKAAAKGKDGAVVSTVRLRVSDAAKRTTLLSLCSRPGTFEWRYGRNKQGPFFLAGSEFAQLWERAGATIASSSDLLKERRSSFTGGISEGRAMALDKIISTVGVLGHATTDRLICYCVRGQTTAEVARGHGVPEREMAAVLNSDLRACARALRYSA